MAAKKQKKKEYPDQYPDDGWVAEEASEPHQPLVEEEPKEMEQQEDKPAWEQSGKGML